MIYAMINVEIINEINIFCNYTLKWQKLIDIVCEFFPLSWKQSRQENQLLIRAESLSILEFYLGKSTCKSCSLLILAFALVMHHDKSWTYLW